MGVATGQFLSKMGNPQAEKEKNLIDKILNLPAFNPLNASDYHTSCDKEHLNVSIKANCSRDGIN